MISFRTFLIIQVVFAGAFFTSYVVQSRESADLMAYQIRGEPACQPVPISRRVALEVSSLHDDSEIVSDEELAAVLDRVAPRFPEKNLKPNHVEHALRTWSVEAAFDDPEVMSGVEMRDVLLDHGRFLASWGPRSAGPLLFEGERGIAVRWDREPGGSVHHDHLLASLSEAGVSLDEKVYAPTGQMTMNDVLQQALCDFDIEGRETEWSALAFALWLPPQKSFTTGNGRVITFDMLAERLMRGDKSFGVCSGTHRVYTLMLLWRINERYSILSEETSEEIYRHLGQIRDLIAASQMEAGCWPSNWAEGSFAKEHPEDEPDYKRVIATGHHLEWLAIAPQELHPPRAQILKAADWLIEHTVAQSDEDIRQRYTFYSHVGNALALWRGTRPHLVWKRERQ